MNLRCIVCDEDAVYVAMGDSLCEEHFDYIKVTTIKGKLTGKNEEAN